MTTKKQSLRLTKQQKEGHGVIGIFGENAKKHDFTVESVSFAVIKHLEHEFPQLSFRYRTHVKKEEINIALQKIDSDLGQTLFVKNSSIIPDGAS